MSGSAPTDDTTWALSAAASGTVEPTTKRVAGWVPGDKPPAEWLNWWQRAVGRWLTYYGAKDAAGGIVGLHDTNRSATWTAASGTGLTVTGQGAGSGASFTSGASANAIGVLGTGAGSSGSVGVKGVGGSGAAGVHGEGTLGGSGVTGLGSPAGDGGTFTSGVNDGRWGVVGTSSATNGRGGKFIGTGSGYGLIAIGGPTGYAAIFDASDTSNPTTATVNFVGQDADPSGPAEGDLYYNLTSHVFRFYNGTTWGNV